MMDATLRQRLRMPENAGPEHGAVLEKFFSAAVSARAWHIEIQQAHACAPPNVSL